MRNVIYHRQSYNCFLSSLTYFLLISRRRAAAGVPSAVQSYVVALHLPTFSTTLLFLLSPLQRIEYVFPSMYFILWKQMLQVNSCSLRFAGNTMHYELVHCPGAESMFFFLISELIFPALFISLIRTSLTPRYSFNNGSIPDIN